MSKYPNMTEADSIIMEILANGAATVRKFKRKLRCAQLVVKR